MHLRSELHETHAALTELTKQTEHLIQRNTEHTSEINKLAKMVNELTIKREIADGKVREYERSKYRLRAENFINQDSEIQFYTGFSSWDMFHCFFKSLSAFDPSNMQYVGKERTYPPGKKRGPPRALNPLNEYFLTLIHVRLGLQERDLADRFGICQSSVSVIFNTWLNLLHYWTTLLAL